MTIQTVVQAIKQEKTTLSAVWEDWQCWQKDSAQTCTTATPYIDAIPEWRLVKIRAGKSEEYCDGVESVLRKFGEGREQIPIHRIAPKELDDWIHSHEDSNNSIRQPTVPWKARSLTSSIIKTACATRPVAKPDCFAVQGSWKPVAGR
ncbi:MAG: hypothetical protein KGJ60_09435, partial [Verrucomicrobiota bacterium]|nr:hypothetical protein [Verrucomicrobiota bacterium]